MEPPPAPAIRFETLVCRLEPSGVRFRLPREEGAPCLLEIKNRLKVGASKVAAERLVDTSVAYSKLAAAVAEVCRTVWAAERDVERLQAFPARKAPEDTEAGVALAGAVEEAPQNVLFADQPAVLPGGQSGVGVTRPVAAASGRVS